MGEQLVQKLQSCSAQSFTQTWHKHKMEWQKLSKAHGSGDWFDGWLCARKCRCRFDFCQCEMTRGKIVLDGKSKENLENNCGIQFFFLVLLSFWTARAYPKLKQQQKIHFRRRLALFEQKNGSGFGQ